MPARPKKTTSAPETQQSTAEAEGLELLTDDDLRIAVANRMRALEQELVSHRMLLAEHEADRHTPEAARIDAREKIESLEARLKVQAARRAQLGEPEQAAGDDASE